LINPNLIGYRGDMQTIDMKSIEMRASDFKRELEPFSFSPQMKQEFFDYWSEPNKSNTKMRYEQEKTWDLGRRLNRWAMNNKDRHNLQKTDTGFREPKLIKEPVTEMEKLDHLLKQYQAKFDSIKFSEFGTWYDFLKQNRLLKTFIKEDIDLLRLAYGDDNYKCRCACVQLTFDAMTYMGKTFAWLHETKQRFNAS
jgi:hypothetical protein